MDRDDPRLKQVAIANAAPCCTVCAGSGFRERSACNCVWRAVFRAGWEMYRQLTLDEAASNSSAVIEISNGRILVGLKNAEFAADFDLIVKQLPKTQQRLFRLHYAEQRPYLDCLGPLGLEPGSFFHEVYRTETAIGKELFRRGMYPLDEYLGVRRVEVQRRYSTPRGTAEVSVRHRSPLCAAA